MELSGQLYAPASLTQEEIAHTNSIEYCVDPTTVLDTLEERKPLSRAVGFVYRVEQKITSVKFWDCGRGMSN